MKSTDALIAELRTMCEQMETVNVDGPAYAKMTAFLTAAPQSFLLQLALERIPFLSSLAFNRLKPKARELFNRAMGIPECPEDDFRLPKALRG